MPQMSDDVIELRALNPAGDLACDLTIATQEARAGLLESFEHKIVRPVRMIQNGVEVTFKPSAWDAVRRYVDLESRCCSFLDLSARRTRHGVTLTVTGRPEARGLIAAIFEER